MKTVAIWNYVILGDSFTWGFPELYAAHVEADLGIRLKLHDWSVGGQCGDQMRKSICTNEKLRNAIRKADLVTFQIPMGIFKAPTIAYIDGTCGGADNLNCLRAALAQYQEDTEAIIHEMLSLASQAVFRGMDCYMPPFLFGEWQRTGAFRVLKTYWEAANKYVAQASSRNAIPVAQVYMAFNGSKGENNPTAYIGEDGWHTNPGGAACIAQLHRELGYEYKA